MSLDCWKSSLVAGHGQLILESYWAWAVGNPPCSWTWAVYTRIIWSMGSVLWKNTWFFYHFPTPNSGKCTSSCSFRKGNLFWLTFIFQKNSRRGYEDAASRRPKEVLSIKIIRNTKYCIIIIPEICPSAQVSQSTPIVKFEGECQIKPENPNLLEEQKFNKISPKLI